MLTFDHSNVNLTLRSFAWCLRQARLRHNQSQSEIAALLGISRATYIKMEAGDPSINIGQWIKASQLLGFTLQLSQAIVGKTNIVENNARQRVSKKVNTDKPTDSNISLSLLNGDHLREKQKRRESFLNAIANNEISASQAQDQAGLFGSSVKSFILHDEWDGDKSFE